jgi:hypothetical protein
MKWQEAGKNSIKRSCMNSALHQIGLYYLSGQVEEMDGWGMEYAGERL